MCTSEQNYQFEVPRTFVANWLQIHGLGSNVSCLFQDVRFSVPFYFTKGVLFSWSQIWLANKDLDGPVLQIGCMKDFRRLVLNPLTGCVEVFEFSTDTNELVRSETDDSIFQGMEPDSFFPAIREMACLPSESFDLSLSGQLLYLPTSGSIAKRDLKRFGRWMNDQSLPGKIQTLLLSLAPYGSITAGTGELLPVCELMEVNDSWEGLVKAGFLIIGFCPCDANAIVLDFRTGEDLIGYMPLEEKWGVATYESLFIPVARSLPIFLHMANQLLAAPFDCQDARMLENLDSKGGLEVGEIEVSP